MTCARCGCGVYQAGDIIALNKVWHKCCFNCYNCKAKLDKCSAKIFQGEVYCEFCYKGMVEKCEIFPPRPCRPCRVVSSPSCGCNKESPNFDYCKDYEVCFSTEQKVKCAKAAQSCGCLPEIRKKTYCFAFPIPREVANYYNRANMNKKQYSSPPDCCPKPDQCCPSKRQTTCRPCIKIRTLSPPRKCCPPPRCRSPQPPIRCSCGQCRPSPCLKSCPTPRPQPCPPPCATPCQLPCPQPCPPPCPQSCPQPCPQPCPRPYPRPCSQVCQEPCSQQCPQLCPQYCPEPCPPPCPPPCSYPCPAKPCCWSCRRPKVGCCVPPNRCPSPNSRKPCAPCCPGTKRQECPPVPQCCCSRPVRQCIPDSGCRDRSSKYCACGNLTPCNCRLGEVRAVCTAICVRCGCKVYAAEKIVVTSGPYHNSCFSCYCCHKLLDVKNVYENCGEIYCKNCYNCFFGTSYYGYGSSQC